MKKFWSQAHGKESGQAQMNNTIPMSRNNAFSKAITFALLTVALLLMLGFAAKPAHAQAIVNGVSYDTLAAAVKAAPSGATIIIDRNTPASDRQDILNGNLSSEGCIRLARNITIQGSQGTLPTISFDANVWIGIIDSGSGSASYAPITATFKDVILDGQGLSRKTSLIRSTSETGGTNTAVLAYIPMTINLEGNTRIQNCSSPAQGAAIWLSTGGIGSSASEQKALATINIKDNAQITNCNSTTSQAGAIFSGSRATSLNIQDNAIISNCSGIRGGALYFENSSYGTAEINISGNAQIVGNYSIGASTGWGGAIEVSGNRSVLNVSENALFKQNKAVETTFRGGGAVFAEQQSTVNISGGTFTENVATKAAAIGADTGAKINISGGLITNNTSTNSDNTGYKNNPKYNNLYGNGAIQTTSLLTSCQLTISGSPQIYGNKSQGFANDSDISWWKDWDTITDHLTAQARIGMNPWTDGERNVDNNFAKEASPSLRNLNRIYRNGSDLLIGINNGTYAKWAYGFDLTSNKIWTGDENIPDITHDPLQVSLLGANDNNDHPPLILEDSNAWSGVFEYLYLGTYGVSEPFLMNYEATYTPPSVTFDTVGATKDSIPNRVKNITITNKYVPMVQEFPEAELTKIVTEPKGTKPSANQNYTFSITPGKVLNSPGIDTSPALAQETFTVTAAEITQGLSGEIEGRDAYFGSVNFGNAIAATGFPAAGIYTYTIAETDPTTDTSTTSMTCSKAKYLLKVYVADEGTFVIKAILLEEQNDQQGNNSAEDTYVSPLAGSTLPDTTIASSRLVPGFTAGENDAAHRAGSAVFFINKDYDKNIAHFSVSKSVEVMTGFDFLDRTKPYQFSLLINAPGELDTKTFTYEIQSANGQQVSGGSITNKTEKTIEITADQKIVFLNTVPADASFKVAETAPDDPSYDTTVIAINKAAYNNGDPALTVPPTYFKAGENTTVAYTNRFNGTVPTGVSSADAPGAEMIVAALGGLALSLATGVGLYRRHLRPAGLHAARKKLF